MPVRRRTSAAPVQYRPPLPRELAAYDGSSWGAPPIDGDGPEWEASHRGAYARYQQACADWFGEFDGMPVDPVTVPAADEPWCGDFEEHECYGASCSRGISER